MVARVLDSVESRWNVLRANAGRQEGTTGPRTVQDVVATNPTRFHPEQNARAIAFELVTTQSPGGAVVTDDDRLIGLLSEIELLHALRTDGMLRELTARDLMNPDPVTVLETTPIPEALELMDARRLLVLPVIKHETDERLVKSLLRSDLILAWIRLAERR